MIDSQGRLHCDGCGKLLALKLDGYLEIYCSRCKRYCKFGTPESRHPLDKGGIIGE